MIWECLHTAQLHWTSHSNSSKSRRMTKFIQISFNNLHWPGGWIIALLVTSNFVAKLSKQCSYEEFIRKYANTFVHYPAQISVRHEEDIQNRTPFKYDLFRSLYHLLVYDIGPCLFILEIPFGFAHLAKRKWCSKVKSTLIWLTNAIYLAVPVEIIVTAWISRHLGHRSCWKEERILGYGAHVSYATSLVQITRQNVFEILSRYREENYCNKCSGDVAIEQIYGISDRLSDVS